MKRFGATVVSFLGVIVVVLFLLGVYSNLRFKPAFADRLELTESAVQVLGDDNEVIDRWAKDEFIEALQKEEVLPPDGNFRWSADGRSIEDGLYLDRLKVDFNVNNCAIYIAYRYQPDNQICIPISRFHTMVKR